MEKHTGFSERLGALTTETLAKLSTGAIVPYDACNADYDKYDDRGDVTYLGTGTIHTINGVKQKDNQVLHFWQFDWKR